MTNSTTPSPAAVAGFEAGRFDLLDGLVTDEVWGSAAALLQSRARSAALPSWSLVEAVLWARSRGESWADIGAALGVSRQAAQQRFGRLTMRDVVAGYLASGVTL